MKMKYIRVMMKIVLISLSTLITMGGCVMLGSVSPAPEPAVPRMSVVSGAEQASPPFAPERPSAMQNSLTALSAGMSSSSGVRRAPVILPDPPKEIKAVWLSYLDLATMMTGKTQTEFTANIKKAFDNMKNYGFNTVFVHVRPFGDAIYKSDYFPWSYLVTGTEGKNPGYDPLAIIVAEAKMKGMRVEAWINPYRVRPDKNTKALSADNQAKIWLDAGDSAVIKYNGVISYNPASEKARKLITDGIREIVKNYSVDGIHIDDYFYPTTDEAFDKVSYSAYKKSGGKLSLADWRRENVSTLIKEIYSAVKETRKNVLFGVSPQSSLKNNYDAQYLDVEQILSEAGYCDYVCPQVYFGFENAVQPYKETIAAWDKLVKADGVKLYTGIASYKIGVTDSWAGSGSAEWTKNSDLMKRMVETARELDNYGGFALYRYDSLFNPDSKVKNRVATESSNLKKIMD